MLIRIILAVGLLLAFNAVAARADGASDCQASYRSCRGNPDSCLSAPGVCLNQCTRHP